MFARTFYNGTIRKYIILFGTMFNNIYINRTADDEVDNNYTQTLKIPLSYGPREKFLARVSGDPDLERPFAMVLPRISFEITSMSYAPERKLATINRVVKSNGAEGATIKYAYNPVPYDIQLELNIMVKNAEDGTKILEQILPYFTPEWTNTINLIPELDVKLDIPIILNGVSYSDTYEGDFISRRAIIWTLNFTLKGYLFGPVKTGTLINLANTALYTSIAANNAEVAVTVYPGLTANGEPTSDPALTVPIGEITADDNFGFIQEFSGVFKE